MRCALAAPILLLAAWAQPAADKPAADPSALENSGKPMAPKFQCTEEDIQSFGLGCTEDEPCPIYLELSAFETVGNQIFAVGNIHSAASIAARISPKSPEAAISSTPKRKPRAAGGSASSGSTPASSPICSKVC